LQAQGVGTVGVNIFIGALPPTPTTVVVIFERGGAAPERSFGEVEFEHPGLEIVTRGETYLEAAQLMDNVYHKVPLLVNQRFNGTWYGALQLQSAPYWVEETDKGHTIMGLDVEAVKQLMQVGD